MRPEALPVNGTLPFRPGVDGGVFTDKKITHDKNINYRKC